MINKLKLDFLKIQLHNYSSFQMSSNEKRPPFPKVKPSRWGHPLIFLASAVGLAGSSAVYYAQIRARQKARSEYIPSCIFR